MSSKTKKPPAAAPPADGQVLELNIDDLTSGECLELEEAAGQSVGQLFREGEVRIAGLIALYWLFKRREQPDYTYEDAKTVKLATITKSLAAGRKA